MKAGFRNYLQFLVNGLIDGVVREAKLLRMRSSTMQYEWFGHVR